MLDSGQYNLRCTELAGRIQFAVYRRSTFRGGGSDGENFDRPKMGNVTNGHTTTTWWTVITAAARGSGKYPAAKRGE